MSRWPIILAIAAGGATGALARYGLSRWLNQSTGAGFPWGTFAANAAGCLLLGFCFHWLGERGSPALRAGLTVGFIGALTTFSTWCLETRHLADDRQFLTAGANMVLSVVVGLAAVWLGIVIARAWFGVS